jgi:hypothetical protein
MHDTSLDRGNPRDQIGIAWRRPLHHPNKSAWLSRDDLTFRLCRLLTGKIRVRGFRPTDVGRVVPFAPDHRDKRHEGRSAPMPRGQALAAKVRQSSALRQASGLPRVYEPPQSSKP